jgi:hypothetical protein
MENIDKYQKLHREYMKSFLMQNNTGSFVNTNTNTNTKINSKFNPNNGHKSNGNSVNMNEDNVSACLRESLKIMEKIQREFENCARNNNMERNMKSFAINLDHNYIYSYSHVSEYEKQIISNQIVETSENRIKNYANLFSIINTSLKDIKDYLIQYKQQKGIYSLYIKYYYIFKIFTN